MLKKLILFLVSAMILMAAPIGAAFADTGGSQPVYYQALSPKYLIWQDPGGKWETTTGNTAAQPGDNVTFSNNYTVPASILEKYNITGAEAYAKFGQEQYDKCYNCGGGHYGLDVRAHQIDIWIDFQTDFVNHAPAIINANVAAHQYNQGQVTVQWNMTLDKDPKWRAYNVTDKDTRKFLGLDNTAVEKYLENAEQGYVWMAPAILTWYGTPKDEQLQQPNLEPGQQNQQNLKVEITECTDEAQPGQAVTVAGQITNESDTPITTLVQWYLGSKKVFEGTVTIDKTKDLHFPFTMPDSSTLVTVQVNPGHNQPPNETNWNDNKDSATVKPIIINIPNNKNMTIIARSRAGDDQFGNFQPSVTRVQGTAKWGDDITVTFKAPDAPSSSATYYRLKAWKLVSAEVTYPKRDPNFTFGHPLDPVGTITKSMNISGNTATATFNEDWSNYGADVYDIIAGEHIPGPTNYNIKVNYKMLWQYEIGRKVYYRDKDGNRHSRIEYTPYSKDITDAVNGQVLVNGTSVIPLAG